MDIYKTSDRIEKAAVKMGYDVDTSYATTGSQYLQLTRDDIKFQINVRVADHAECYLPRTRAIRQVCVSPEELTATQAIDLLTRPDDIPITEVRILTSEEKKRFAEAIKQEKESAQQRNANWRALRETLTQADYDEFKNKGQSRNSAREMAAARNMKAGQLYAALTNGRKF